MQSYLLLTLSVKDGIKIVGMSNPHLFKPGLLQSSCVICISTRCRSLSVPAVSALLKKNLNLSPNSSFKHSEIEKKIVSHHE